MLLPGHGPGVRRTTLHEHYEQFPVYVRNKVCLMCGAAFATYVELLAHTQTCEPPPRPVTTYTTCTSAEEDLHAP